MLSLSGPLPNDGNFFIIADNRLRNIYQVDATSGVALYPTSVAYDPTAKLIYWADSHAHTINRYSLVTDTSTVIYRDPSNAGKDT